MVLLWGVGAWGSRRRGHTARAALGSAKAENAGALGSVFVRLNMVVCDGGGRGDELAY